MTVSSIWTPVISDEALRKLMATYVTVDGCRLINRDWCIVSETGQLIARLVKGCIPLELQNAARPGLLRARGDFSNRGSFVGKNSMMPRQKADGTFSRRRAVPKSVLPLLGKTAQLGIFDYRDPNTGEISCRQTQWMIRDLPACVGVMPLIEKVSEIFRQTCPEQYAAQKEEVAKIHPEYDSFGSEVFRDLTVNIDARGPVHTDKGDLRSGTAALTADGEFQGAELILPRYGLAFDVRPGDVLFFNPHEAHANAPLEGNRISLVYYVRGKLHLCQPSTIVLESNKVATPEPERI